MPNWSFLILPFNQKYTFVFEDRIYISLLYLPIFTTISAFLINFSPPKNSGMLKPAARTMEDIINILRDKYIRINIIELT